MSQATATSSSDGDTVSTTSDDNDGDVPSTITATHGSGHTAVTVVPRDEEGHHAYWSRDGGFHSWMGIIALFVIAGIIKTAIRARHGDFRTNRQRRADARAGVGFVPPIANRENEALAEENARLRAQATRMEERIAVLERIVTDPAKRVSDEIDALR